MIANVFSTEYNSGQLTELSASLQESLTIEYRFEHSPKSWEVFLDRVCVILLYI